MTLHAAFFTFGHRVGARPVLPLLFRLVPGLGPELVLLGPGSLHVHRLDIFRVYAADRLDLMEDLKAVVPVAMRCIRVGDKVYPFWG